MIFKAVSGTPFANLILFVVRLLYLLSRCVLALGALQHRLHWSGRSLGLDAVVVLGIAILAAGGARGPLVDGLVGLGVAVGAGGGLDLEPRRLTAAAVAVAVGGRGGGGGGGWE